MWAKFNCRSIFDDSNLYLKILLLVIFFNISDRCFKNYDLDATVSYTVHDLSFLAVLKTTNVKVVKLKLTTSWHWHSSFYGRWYWGRYYARAFTQVNNNFKYDDANDFDSNKDVVYHNYFDVANPYGRASIQPLPIGDFEWLTDHIEIFAKNI